MLDGQTGCLGLDYLNPAFTDDLDHWYWTCYCMVCFDYPLLGGRHHIETFKGMVAYGTMDVNVSVEVTQKNVARVSLTVCVTTYMSFVLSRISGGLLVLLNI